MPVAAVAGAVFAGAELVAGGLTIFQTIAAVGAITAGVGAVTGDQDLMKIGAIGSLAGGVGMFAQNQGWLNTAQAAAEAGGNTAAMIGQQAPGMESVAPTVDTGMGAAETVNTVTGDNLMADLGEGGNIAQGITDTTGVTQSPTMNTQPGGLLNASPSNPLDQRLAAGKVGEAANESSIFKSMKKFADMLKNKDGTYDKNLLAIGANFLGGAFDDKKKAETDYYRSRTASEDAQRTNANSVPSLAGLKVSDKNIFTPNASTYTPVRVGLINAR
jgi:hypothetical protein